eukprot:m.63393 g.63393  ORF g.63393 m.63393 type:complete len:449 (+) comp7456_c0_seq1:2982-4328(+)
MPSLNALVAVLVAAAAASLALAEDCTPLFGTSADGDVPRLRIAECALNETHEFSLTQVIAQRRQLATAQQLLIRELQAEVAAQRTRTAHIEAMLASLTVQFKWQARLATSVHARNPRSGDVDGDGLLEPLFTGYLNDQVFSMRNRGNGQFQPRTVLSGFANCRPLSAELVDVNGDQLPDLYFACYDRDLILFALNLGSFVFDASQSVSATSRPSAMATLARGNGSFDLLYTSFTHGLYRRLVVDGRHSGETAIAVCSGAQDLVVADVDSDGLDDVVFACHSDNLIAWIRSLDSGFAADHTVLLENTLGVFSIAMGDVDGDGHVDLVWAEEGTTTDPGRLAWARLSTQGTVAATTTLHVAAFYDVELGDLDGDGDLDLVAAVGSDGFMMFFNVGGGVFDNGTAITSAPSIEKAWGVHLVDFTNDGFPDLLVSTDTEVHWLRNEPALKAP